MEENKNLKEEKLEKETVGELSPFITFLVGLRDNPDFQMKTNVVDCNIGDFAASLAAIELNMMLQTFKVGGLEAIEKLLKTKEICVLSSARLLPDEGNEHLSKEEISEFKEFLGIPKLEELIKQKREESKSKETKETSKSVDLKDKKIKKIDLD